MDGKFTLDPRFAVFFWAYESQPPTRLSNGSLVHLTILGVQSSAFLLIEAGFFFGSLHLNLCLKLPEIA